MPAFSARKLYLKAISLLIVMVFLLENSVYPMDLQKKYVQSNNLVPNLRTNPSVLLEWEESSNSYKISLGKELLAQFKKDAEFHYVSRLIGHFLQQLEDLRSRDLSPTEDYLQDQFALFKKAIIDQDKAGIINLDRFKIKSAGGKTEIAMFLAYDTVWLSYAGENTSTSQLLCYYLPDKSTGLLSREEIPFGPGDNKVMCESLGLVSSEEFASDPTAMISAARPKILLEELTSPGEQPLSLEWGKNINNRGISAFYQYLQSLDIDEKTRQQYFTLMASNVLASTLDLSSLSLKNALSDILTANQDPNTDDPYIDEAIKAFNKVLSDRDIEKELYLTLSRIREPLELLSFADKSIEIDGYLKGIDEGILEIGKILTSKKHLDKSKELALSTQAKKHPDLVIKELYEYERDILDLLDTWEPGPNVARAIILRMAINMLSTPGVKNIYDKYLPIYFVIKYAAFAKYDEGKLEDSITLLDFAIKRAREFAKKVTTSARHVSKRDIIHLLSLKAHCLYYMHDYKNALSDVLESKKNYEKFTLETQDPAAAGVDPTDLVRILLLISNIYAEIGDWENARKYIDLTMATGHEDPLHAGEMYMDAAEIYLRGQSFFKDIDALEIAEKYSLKAHTHPTKEEFMNILDAWILFEKGAYDEAAALLEEIKIFVPMGRAHITVVRLYRGIALHYYKTGRTDEAKAMAEKAFKVAKGTDVFGVFQAKELALGKKIMLDALNDILLSPEEAAKKTEEVLLETTENQENLSNYINIGRMNLAFTLMSRHAELGQPMTFRDADGKIQLYASSLIEVSKARDPERVAWSLESEYRWYPKEYQKYFLDTLNLIIEEDSTIVPSNIKLNIIFFLKLIQKPGESPAKIITKLEELKLEIAPEVSPDKKNKNNKNGGKKNKKSKKSPLLKILDQALSELRGNYTSTERLQNAERAFALGDFSNTLTEAATGTSVSDNNTSQDIRDGLVAYERVSALALSAIGHYNEQSFKEALADSEAAEAVATARHIKLPEALVKVTAKAKTMASSEESYLSGENEKAIQLSKEIDDEVSVAFRVRMRDVIQIEEDPSLSMDRLNRLRKKHPKDARLKAFADGVHAAETKKNQLVKEVRYTLEGISLRLSKRDLTNEALDAVLDELISKIFKVTGYHGGAWGIMVQTIRLAYDNREYESVLYFIEKCAPYMPKEPNRKKDELYALKEKAIANLSMLRLKRHFDIIDSRVKADNLITEEKLRKFKQSRTLDYNFAKIEKDADSGKIILSGLFYTIPYRENQKVPIPDVKSAITKGETYVLADKDSSGNPIQFFLTAVKVNHEFAEFEIPGDEDRIRAFKEISENTGTIRKVQDPSLVHRRDLLHELRTSVELSMFHKNSSPSTKYYLIDLLLGLQTPPQGEAQNPNRPFKNKNIERDPTQSLAVKAALDVQTPLTLIQGPPGTGKTSVIVELVRQFSSMGKKVLVVSQSNPGIDNVGIRLKEADKDIQFARVGNNETSVDPELRENWKSRKYTLKEMASVGRGAVVLGTTNGFFSDRNISGNEFYSKNYDVVIIEEAGRATLAETLFPLSKASNSGKVILVGDHKQLPAYGIDREQKNEAIQILSKNGKDKSALVRLRGIMSRKNIEDFKTSLFETLWEKGQDLKEKVHKHLLLINRRSHPAITGLVSTLFYKGEIKPDPSNTAPLERDTITLIDYAKNEKVKHYEELQELYEERVGTSYRNLKEANIVIDEFDRYMNQTYSGENRYTVEDITIVTPHMPQRLLIKQGFEVKAIMNDVLSSGESIDIESSEKIVKAFRGDLEEKERDGALKALSYLQKSSRKKDEEHFTEAINTLTHALMFDVKKRHGARSITVSSLNTLGLFEVETVDSIQGSENKVVILSLTRSNTGGAVGFLGTEDGLQRLNVAFSRAQEKFTVIGDFTHTLTHAKFRAKKRSDFTKIAAENTKKARETFQKALEYMDNLKENFKKINAEIEARNFLNELSATSQKVQDKGNLIIGLDTSWVPDMTSLQSLVSTIRWLSGNDNITIITGKGEELAGKVLDAKNETGTAASNIIVLGSKDAIGSSSFNDLRNNSADNRPCFITVNPQKLEEMNDPSQYNYIRIVEMLSVALTIAFSDEVSIEMLNQEHPFIQIQGSKDSRSFIFIPAAELLDLGELKRLYKIQESVIQSA